MIQNDKGNMILGLDLGGLPELDAYAGAGFEARRRRSRWRRKWNHRLQLELPKLRTHFPYDARKQSKLPQIS